MHNKERFQLSRRQRRSRSLPSHGRRATPWAIASDLPPAAWSGWHVFTRNLSASRTRLPLVAEDRHVLPVHWPAIPWPVLAFLIVRIGSRREPPGGSVCRDGRGLAALTSRRAVRCRNIRCRDSGRAWAGGGDRHRARRRRGTAQRSLQEDLCDRAARVRMVLRRRSCTSLTRS
jgi:hypothetical protein